MKQSYLMVFVAGVVGMIYELAGVRLLIPYYGNSTITWTAIISTFLGSIALGAWIGGVLADRKEFTMAQLANMLTVAAIFSAAMLFVNSLVLILLCTKIKNIYLSSFMASIAMFALPSIILGMIFPFMVKHAVKLEGFTATTIGKLSAFSTVGSIAGTILAGFVLIPSIGTNRILYLLPLLLISMAIALSPKKHLLVRLVLMLFIIKATITPTDGVLAIVFGQDKVESIDSTFCRYIVYQSERDERPTINLTNTPFAVQSIRYTDHDDDFLITKTYADFFRLTDYFQTETSKNVLMLGGGAFIFPQYYNNMHPDVSVDVVEIDPALPGIAKKYFKFSPNKNLTVHTDDARRYLEKTNQKYDHIYLDVFTSAANIPFHLTTTEFFDTLSGSLTEKGYLAFNIVSAVTGEKSKMYKSIAKTIQQHFKQIYIFPVNNSEKSGDIQNITFFASNDPQRKKIVLTGDKHTNELLSLYLDAPGSFEEGLFLTDNYAPTEYMLTLNYHQ